MGELDALNLASRGRWRSSTVTGRSSRNGTIAATPTTSNSTLTGFAVVVAVNQSWVSRGLLSERDRVQAAAGGAASDFTIDALGGLTPPRPDHPGTSV